MQTTKYEIREGKIYKITEQVIDPDKSPEEAVRYAKWMTENGKRKGGRPKKS